MGCRNTKRPRDASCLSVVSFTSRKRPGQSFIVSYIGCRLSLRTIKCCSVGGAENAGPGNAGPENARPPVNTANR